MPATLADARAGATTGEWAGALREVFGEYRAPTGVSAAVGRRGQDMVALALYHAHGTQPWGGRCGGLS